MDKLELGSIEYFTVQNPDGTFRDGTPEERAAFKPTHVETYGTHNNRACCFKTNLQTQETEIIYFDGLPNTSRL